LGEPYKESDIDEDVNDGTAMEDTHYKYIQVVFLTVKLG
jgi:hypothetical protein